MRLVDRTTFLAMPVGTIFTKYRDPIDPDCISIKGETFTNDFILCDIQSRFDYCDYSLENGEIVPANFGDAYRDGLRDDGERYVIYTTEEVESIIELLKEALAKTGGQP